MAKRVRQALGVTYGWLVLLLLYVPALVVIPLALSTSPFLVFPPPDYSLEWFSQFVADPTWVNALIRSVQVAAAAAILATLAGLAGAYYITRRKGWQSGVIEPLMVMPLVIPSIVFALGVYTLALQFGLVGNMAALILTHAVLGLPFAYINITVGLSTIDPRLELAAISLGAGPMRAFTLIILPLLLPALFAALTLSFVLSLDETVVALFISGDRTPTLPVKMFSSITYDLSPLVPVAATVLLLLTVMSVLTFVVLRIMVSRLLRLRQG